jgi:hypothetical protein
MRQPAILRTFVILAALCFAVRAHADDRSDARAHYQAGVKFYAGGDYQGAIREFSAAQQLVPADLNNYNLALCYDKLGDAEPAIQYYRAFLDKQPGTDKRAEIEASVSRLEAASRSAASKKTEARRADDARKAARPDDAAGPPPPPPAAGPVLGPAAPPPSGAVAGPPPPPASGPVLGPAAPPPPAEAAPEPRRRGPAVAGSIGTPGTAAPAPTGDAQLDRAQSINIDEIRDQRGVAGIPSERRGGPVAAMDAPPGGEPGAQPAGPPLAPNSQPGSPDAPAPDKPVYKKWWFWVVMGVATIVVYSVVTQESSRNQQTFSREQPVGRTAQPGGLTLMSW